MTMLSEKELDELLAGDLFLEWGNGEIPYECRCWQPCQHDPNINYYTQGPLTYAINDNPVTKDVIDQVRREIDNRTCSECKHFRCDRRDCATCTDCAIIRMRGC